MLFGGGLAERAEDRRRFDAKYHIGVNSFGDDDARFNPMLLSRDELVANMDMLGCRRLNVRHSVQNKGAHKRYVMLDTRLNEAQKTAKGKNKKVARLPELRFAAIEWLVENKPEILMNDFEYRVQRQHRHYVECSQLL